jgi:hypothetical protein
MPTGVVSWSKVAASNATADSNVNFAEGQAPSSLNDSARALMASVAMYRDDVSGALTTSGSSTAYTLSTNQVFPSLAAMSGKLVAFVPHATNGASPTLNVDGLGAKTILTASGTAVATGALLANAVYGLTYDNSIPGWLLHDAYGAVATDAVATASIQNLAVSTAKIAANAVTDAKLRQSSATSVIGRSANSTGDVADIAAATDGHFLRLSGTTLGFGAPVAGSVPFSALASAATAAQSDLEVASSTALIVTPGRMQYHPGVAKAWAIFDNSATIVASHNITSITRTGTASYTVTIATDFSSANYAVTLSYEDNSSKLVFVRVNGAKSAGSFDIVVRDSGNGPLEVSLISFSCYGDQ